MNVMITGAAGGLGRAMAVECARRGYALFLTDIDAPALAAIQKGLSRRFCVKIYAEPCDLTDSAGVDALMAEIDRLGLRFDMLLNIAGIDYEGGFLRRDREKIVRIVALNDEGTLRVTHAVLQRRNPDARFCIVVVSSLAALFPMPLKATYAASKRFLMDFGMALRQELKGQGANVLTLCPGGLSTNDEVCAAILAQGVAGSLTTNAMERVVRKTLDLAWKGRARYIPGAFNRLLFLLGKAVPASWTAALIFRRWTQTQKKWLYPTQIP